MTVTLTERVTVTFIQFFLLMESKMAGQMYFQWQNEILCKTIYPMRLNKLRDFLVLYREVDLWAEYKNKDISTLQSDVQAYYKGIESARKEELQKFSKLKTYFMTPDVRSHFAKYQPIDEAELAEIQKSHQLFITSWPKDIRGERPFVKLRMDSWSNHVKVTKDWINSRQRRLAAMIQTHPNRPKEEQELRIKESVTLPMAMDELDKLYEFDATYDKLEQPRLEWYKLTRADPNFKTTETDFLTSYKPGKPLTVRDIVRLKVEEYAKSLEGKDQYQLLAEIRQRFEKEPKRFPHWLQYMVVHFSGMRYASAHGSWADPKDLLVALRIGDVQKEQLALTDAEVEAKCKEKIAQYGGSGTNKPKLATATEKAWKDKVARHMLSVKASGPKTRRAGLLALAEEEVRYEFMSLTTDQALAKLETMKSSFPAWAWKLIVKMTSLRVNYVKEAGWENLTPEEETARAARESASLNKIISDWVTKHTVGWRDEHGRTHELIVSRAVCNETAEHVQHIRGNLPPGGLTPKPGWYAKLEKEKSGSYYVKPKSAADYTPGASILWLRFVNSQPNEWQLAHPIATKDGEGLLPGEYLGKRKVSRKDTTVPWTYKPGDVITRTRTTVDANKQKINQTQWLRWIHEATVAEVAETADGTYVYTFETSLPDDDRGTSCLGLFRNTLNWNLSDGAEDAYNRSFVGYTPEGQVPMIHLNTMLDWNKILRKR
jgi:hypothetical protein